MIPSFSHHLRAILFALAGFTLWVCGDSCIKLATAYAVPKYEIVAVACVSGMVALWVVTALRGRLAALRPRHRQGLLILGLLITVNYAVWVIGLQHLPLTNFYAVIFMSPLFVSFLASRFLREPMAWPKIAATIVGFIGVLIAVDVLASHDRGSWIGYGLALAGAFIMSLQQLTLRFLADRESRECTAFYPRLGPFVACLAMMPIWGVTSMPLVVWFYAFLIGTLGGIGWLFVAEAYQRAPAATVAPFHYSQIISGAVLGYVLWGDVPSLHLIIGAVLIVAAGIYIALHTHNQRALPDVPEVSV